MLLVIIVIKNVQIIDHFGKHSKRKFILQGRVLQETHLINENGKDV